MLEWLKRHAWKACIRQNRISGSNPDLSARYFTFLLKACSHCAIAPESKITFKQEQKIKKLDDVECGGGNRIPLWMFGCMY